MKNLRVWADGILVFEDIYPDKQVIEEFKMWADGIKGLDRKSFPLTNTNRTKVCKVFKDKITAITYDK